MSCDDDRIAKPKALLQSHFEAFGGRMPADTFRRLFHSMPDDEVEVLMQFCGVGADGCLQVETAIEFLFGGGGHGPAAGSGVAAVKQQRDLPQTERASGAEGMDGVPTPPPAADEAMLHCGTMSPEQAKESLRLHFADSAAAKSTVDSLDEMVLIQQSSYEKRAMRMRRWAVPTQLDRSLAREFLELDQGGKVQVEYVYLDCTYTDGDSFDMCSKSMTVNRVPMSVEDLPIWTYSSEDGGKELDIIMVPRRIYRDPFRRGDNIIVLTDSYLPPEPGTGTEYGEPASWNTRAACDAAMSGAISHGEEPWFGIEQEYYLLDAKTNWPLGWPDGGFPGPQGAYFCATGAAKAPGREVVESHYRACLYAGVQIGGINSEVAPGQWEFQVGPGVGTAAADDLWMARYLLQRTCELFHVNVTFDPKPVSGWAGIGCHTNYSTKATRAPGGFKVIEDHCRKLAKRHLEHMMVYGRDNQKRLSGNDDTQHFDKFSWDVGDRNHSIRIPVKAASTGCGYYEDRRPAANMDPYLVQRYLVETTLLLEDDEDRPSLIEDAQRENVVGELPAPLHHLRDMTPSPRPNQLPNFSITAPAGLQVPQ